MQGLGVEISHKISLLHPTLQYVGLVRLAVVGLGCNLWAVSGKFLRDEVGGGMTCGSKLGSLFGSSK